jgi:putative transposase
VWWMQLGIVVERIEPGHPEQNGVHERMHGTLKADTIRPAAANGRAQQRRCSRWRAEFNEHRPHEALSMQTPSQWYRCARRRLPRRLKPWSYSWEYAVRRVRHNGEIKWRGRRRYVGQALHGVAVGLKPTDHGTTAVYLGSLWLGDLDQTDAGGLRPTVSSPRIENEMKCVTHVLR